MIYDTHCHPQLGEYAGDCDQVINKCLQHGIGLIAVGTTLHDSVTGIDLANRYSHVWVSIGLHPSNVFNEAFNPQDFRKLINPRVVAVGETGLDYFHTEEATVSPEEFFAKQVEVFKAHIQLARTRDLPLILHIRNGKDRPTAYADTLSILRRHRWHRGVVHCWGGTPEEARGFVAAGFYLGFTANITYPKNTELLDIIAAIPLERILVETDSPFLAPQSRRGQRNEPAHVIEVIKKIAAVRNLAYEEVAQATADNARKLFGIKG
jgi:TatD DNase family protein